MFSVTRLLSLAVALAGLPVTTTAQQAAIPNDTSAERGPSRPVRATFPCELARIVDGDTIECRDRTRVRLIGIDTPELSQEPYGEMAREALAAMLDSTKTLALEPDVEPQDRYGRALAYVWVDSSMVNWLLVRRGWAVLLTYPPNVQYADYLAKAQQIARDEEVGLWGMGGFECLPRDRRRGHC